MSTSDTSIAQYNSQYLQSLVDYVLEVKPYRTKLSLSGAVSEEYVFSDTVNVSIVDEHRVRAFLGPDLIPSTTAIIGGSRGRLSSSWIQDAVSDGVRRTWEITNVTIPAFASHSLREHYQLGSPGYYDIPGLSYEVADPRRWDFSGITDVQLNGVHQQESVDYFLSRGVFSFDVEYADENGAPGWIRHDINLSIPTVEDVEGMLDTGSYPETNPPYSNTLPAGSLAASAAFNIQPGVLRYNDVVRLGGALTNIVCETYEEFIAVCTSIEPSTLTVYDANNIVIGTVVQGGHFSLSAGPVTRLAFDFELEPNYEDESSVVGDRYLITPAEQITVAPDAPEETWSLIKVAPIGIGVKPTWIPAGAHPAGIPAMEVHAAHLEGTPEANWTIVFDGAGHYVLAAVDTLGYPLAGYPKTLNLQDGCSYADSTIAFTIIPTVDGWKNGDTFAWSTNGRSETYKVFGSVSGWTVDLRTGRDAEVGRYFWNGKVGFKIPRLELFGEAYYSTISSLSPSGEWSTLLNNGSQLNRIWKRPEGVFVAGPGSVVGASTDGLNWTSKIETVFVSTGPSDALIIPGKNGAARVTFDALNWIDVQTPSTEDLHAFTVIPNFLASPGSLTNDLNCTIMVGDGGEVLTSVDNESWTSQHLNVPTSANLRGLTYSPTLIVVVGDDGTIISSPDRLTWSLETCPVAHDLHDVLYDGTAFIAVGDQGTVIRSVDGHAWFDLNPLGVSSVSLSSIAFDGSEYLIVGESGICLRSNDGVTWVSSSSRHLDSVAGLGNGWFIGVGGSETSLASLIPDSARPLVSVQAVPSSYTITFTSASDFANGIPGKAKVFNSVTGFGKNLTTDELWSDEWTSFTLSASEVDFRVGDVYTVYLAPGQAYPTDLIGYQIASQEQGLFANGFDTARYDTTPYDTIGGSLDTSSGIRNARVPLTFTDELFPLYHSHGAVIFPAGAEGDEAIIDKAFDTGLSFKLNGADTLYPELGSTDDWLPLYFKRSAQVDQNDVSVPVAPAPFSDFSPFIEAFSAATGERVFYIVSPRFNKTNRAAGSILTIDEDFFNKYLIFNTKYTFQVTPNDNYVDHIRVKIAEAIKLYGRIQLDFTDETGVDVDDSFHELTISIASSDEPTIQVEDAHELTVDDEGDESVGSQLTEGLGISMRVVADFTFAGYDLFDYDTDEYDNGLTEFNETAGDVVSTQYFDFDIRQPAGSTIPSLTTGLLVEPEPASTGKSTADKYRVTLINPPGTITTIVLSSDDLSSSQSIAATYARYLVYDNNTVSFVDDTNTLSFSVPSGISAPFRMWLI
jgi:photosystem II stability/assembly factor-like uncharacterized protein